MILPDVLRRKAVSTPKRPREVRRAPKAVSIGDVLHRNAGPCDKLVAGGAQAHMPDIGAKPPFVLEEAIDRASREAQRLHDAIALKDRRRAGSRARSAAPGRMPWPGRAQA